jgi:hypothetical protein
MKDEKFVLLFAFDLLPSTFTTIGSPHCLINKVFQNLVYYNISICKSFSNILCFSLKLFLWKPGMAADGVTGFLRLASNLN